MSHRTAIVFLIGLGATLSMYAFFPGWMSVDSVTLYHQAINGTYDDSQPVTLAMWWRRLAHIYPGPALLLFQDLAMYWGTACLFVLGGYRKFGAPALGVAIVPFWPGLLFPLGQIWKDIFFACSLMLAWAIVFWASGQHYRLGWKLRACIVVLLVLAFGAKFNGIVAIPFFAYYWAIYEGWGLNVWRRGLAVVGITCGIALAPALITFPVHVTSNSTLSQYTQSYDLLAISVDQKQILPPAYIVDRVKITPANIHTFYFPGGNNLMFYNTPAGNLTTKDPEQVSELRNRWIGALFAHPGSYIRHRLATFRELMRFGNSNAAWVAAAETQPNPWGFAFTPNVISDALSASTKVTPWVYFPWLYCLIGIVGAGLLSRDGRERVFAAALGGSILAFIVPHILIVPAADYRYLYYAVFGSLVLATLGVASAAGSARPPHRAR